jgi:hypothetical protein
VRGVKIQAIKMIQLRIFFFFLPLHFICSQLIGSCGIIKLKEGVEYRDAETVGSSKAVAKFAKQYQPYIDNVAKARKAKLKPSHYIVIFSTRSLSKVGTKLMSSYIFDFPSCRLRDPLEELRLNKPLKEIENS